MADDSRSSNSSNSESESEIESIDHKSQSTSKGNVFKNDGSFMEMFKKMQDERNKKDSDYFDTDQKKPQTDQSEAISESLTVDTAEAQSSSSSQPTKKPSVMSFVRFILV